MQEALGKDDYDFYGSGIAEEKRKQDIEIATTGQEMHWVAEERDGNGNPLFLDKWKMKIERTRFRRLLLHNSATLPHSGIRYNPTSSETQYVSYQPLAPVQVVLGKEFCLLATSEEEIIFRVCENETLKDKAMVDGFGSAVARKSKQR